MRSDERGFTMVTVVGALLAVTMLTIAALAYAQGDLKPGAHDRDRKIAYAAAEAGIQNYAYYLSQDPAFWAKCAVASAHVNQRWNGIGNDPRTWTAMPSDGSSYAVELLPANGTSACDPNNADATMIDTTTGTFRIRATGRAMVGGVKRSIVVNFKRQSLLDYIYFTDKETRSPLLYDVQEGSVNTRNAAGQTLTQWATANCDRYYGSGPAGGRQGQHYDGEMYDEVARTWMEIDPNPGCSEIDFIDPDVTAGPFHTNDEFSCSGAPDFGQLGHDVVETSSTGQTSIPTIPAIGFFSPPSGAMCSPNFIGTRVRNAPKLELPPTNQSLYRDTAPNYRFVGETKIKLEGANMTVTGTREDGAHLSDASVPLPADGVIYVANSKAFPCPGYNVTKPYQPVDHDACGNLDVSGNYSVNLTMTAENDIVIMDDIMRPEGDPPSPDVLLGLISNNFIRVYHPVTGCDPIVGCNFHTDSCPNAGGPGAIKVDAAILSLKQSFIADNWHCGASLGNLTVRGAIVQKFRGPVGKSTPAPAAGYVKDYSYDRRLRYRSPPKFLDPVQAAWRIQTYNEQVPAR